MIDLSSDRHKNLNAEQHITPSGKEQHELTRPTNNKTFTHRESICYFTVAITMYFCAYKQQTFWRRSFLVFALVCKRPEPRKKSVCQTAIEILFLMVESCLVTFGAKKSASKTRPASNKVSKSKRVLPREVQGKDPLVIRSIWYGTTPLSASQAS